jgi:hypothetical protein
MNKFRQSLYVPTDARYQITEKEKQQALEDFVKRFPGFQDVLPRLPEKIVSILGSDFNQKRRLKKTKAKLVEGTGESELQLESSIQCRLDRAINALKADNARLKRLI